MKAQVGDKVRSSNDVTTKGQVVKVTEKRVAVRESDTGEWRWSSLLDFNAEWKSDAERSAARKVAALLQREAK